MSTNFNKILETAIGEIHRELSNNYESKYRELSEKYTDTETIEEIKNRISKMEHQRAKLYDDIQRAEKELREAKTSVTFEQEKWLRENGYSSYSATEADYKARKELHDGIEKQNEVEFDNLKRKFLNAMNLAVGAKEKREVLFKFYSLDWKSLGISIPPDMNFAEVEIKDGKIISDSSKLLSN